MRDEEKEIIAKRRRRRRIKSQNQERCAGLKEGKKRESFWKVKMW